MGAGSSVTENFTADAPSEAALALVDKLGPGFDSLKARVTGLSSAALVDEVRAFQSFLDVTGPPPGAAVTDAADADATAADKLEPPWAPDRSKPLPSLFAALDSRGTQLSSLENKWDSTMQAAADAREANDDGASALALASEWDLLPGVHFAPESILPVWQAADEAKSNVVRIEKLLALFKSQPGRYAAPDTLAAKKQKVAAAEREFAKWSSGKQWSEDYPDDAIWAQFVEASCGGDDPKATRIGTEVDWARLEKAAAAPRALIAFCESGGELPAEYASLTKSRRSFTTNWKPRAKALVGGYLFNKGKGGRASGAVYQLIGVVDPRTVTVRALSGAKGVSPEIRALGTDPNAVDMNKAAFLLDLLHPAPLETHLNEYSDAIDAITDELVRNKSYDLPNELRWECIEEMPEHVRDAIMEEDFNI